MGQILCGPTDVRVKLMCCVLPVIYAGKIWAMAGMRTQVEWR